MNLINKLSDQFKVHASDYLAWPNSRSLSSLGQGAVSKLGVIKALFDSICPSVNPRVVTYMVMFLGPGEQTNVLVTLVL